ncbi:MAG: RelA/SpoT family protein [Candidatus Niyogibacteria bacterium]|nr:RelA/SpoT family protein [Candidatus Niyogibacteria bacterium]
MTWIEYKKQLPKSHFSKEDLNLLEAAFLYATKAHERQKRHSGDDYILHPIAVSLKVAEIGLDSQTIAAALLHDTVEDKGAELKEIRKRFGENIAFLVDGVTKVDKLRYHGVERTVESMRKMFLAVAKDVRVVIIKLCDRLHNMETLSSLPYPEKRERIAKETLDIYASVADRLGMGEIKAQLEDLAFRYVYPDEYFWIEEEVKKRLPEREIYLERVMPIIKKELNREGIKALEIHARAKHYYSLWKKLQRYDMDWERIFDLVAVRIIIHDVNDAYGVLGLIHKHWKPLPGRIKDYIALPKPNGYQSLHTTVFCIDGQIVEFQIRTEEMHKEAEFGIAAHWMWEHAGKPKEGASINPKLAWVAQLKEWQSSFRKGKMNSEDFLESLKIDFFKDRIFVLTPKGDVIDLPEGATSIDFAYHIHSEIGDHAVGAKVNGKMSSFDAELHSGDVVEILTKKNQHPSREWLTFVKTSMARNHIRRYVREQTGKILLRKQEPIEIVVEIEDRVGILKDVSSAIASSGISIKDIESHVRGDNAYASIKISFIPHSKDDIHRVRARIKRVKGVQSVKIGRRERTI